MSPRGTPASANALAALVRLSCASSFAGFLCTFSAVLTISFITALGTPLVSATFAVSTTVRFVHPAASLCLPERISPSVSTTTA